MNRLRRSEPRSCDMHRCLNYAKKWRRYCQQCEDQNRRWMSTYEWSRNRSPNPVRSPYHSKHLEKIAERAVSIRSADECETTKCVIATHHDAMKDDPEALSTDFMLRMLYEEEEGPCGFCGPGCAIDCSCDPCHRPEPED